MRGEAIPVTAALAVVVAGLGGLDYLSGPDITFTALYVAPVLLGAWFAGRAAGWTLAVLASTANLFADLLLPERPFDLLAIPAWNVASRLVVFAIAAEALAKIRSSLDERARLIAKLEAAIAEIRTLQGLLPICAWCKRIRDEGDQDSWKDVERYVAEHSTAEFTHGICPECEERVGHS